MGRKRTVSYMLLVARETVGKRGCSTRGVASLASRRVQAVRSIKMELSR
jgi:hypothetical protein